ncbi:predicted protein [Coccidioides posadasii str. Silveira]|uniref:Predicted protein n=2 Tax=Coccidioides posadasii TaxID=199306 RepID=E9D2K6_COCPS|nr:predicted protein [Coccidioides posadasii str. Silveira]KMM71880.1 hypothetical protein CPAG_08181 [Coccidioides posadasii RMSCC 3488]
MVDRRTGYMVSEDIPAKTRSKRDGSSRSHPSIAALWQMRIGRAAEIWNRPWRALSEVQAAIYRYGEKLRLVQTSERTVPRSPAEVWEATLSGTRQMACKVKKQKGLEAQNTAPYSISSSH